MSQLSIDMSAADARDQESDDRDEAARQRDLVGASRDEHAAQRDLRADDQMRAAVHYAQILAETLDAHGQADDSPSAVQDAAVLRELLLKLTNVLQSGEADRHAALADRQAAAIDRLLAADDRDIETSHRAHAAIERAQQAAYSVTIDPVRRADLVEAARSARARAAALCQRVAKVDLSPPAHEQKLTKSLLARQAARLETMPVIEQAKGIIMVQRRCDAVQAFSLLRQASQRLNEPVRNIADRIVATAINPPER